MEGKKFKVVSSTRIILLQDAPLRVRRNVDAADDNDLEAPRAPFWTKPDKMERKIYAEPINKAVSARTGRFCFAERSCCSNPAAVEESRAVCLSIRIQLGVGDPLSSP